MDSPPDRWPVFLTFDQRTLATLARDKVANRGERAGSYQGTADRARSWPASNARGGCSSSFDHDGGERSILQRFSEDTGIDIEH